MDYTTNISLENSLANYLHNRRLLAELNSVKRTSKERMDFWLEEKSKFDISGRNR
jgi:hypothetical protein